MTNLRVLSRGVMISQGCSYSLLVLEEQLLCVWLHGTGGSSLSFSHALQCYCQEHL